MRREAIAPNVLIVFLAALAGCFGAAAAGFVCYYKDKPYGSACVGESYWVPFAIAAAATALTLYGIWGVARVVRRNVRRLRGK